MRQYRELVADIYLNGHNRGDRTGTGTRSVFGRQMRFDLSEGFPIVTSKRTAFHAAKIELLWMLKGDTNLDYLHEHNVHIWDDWRRPWNKGRDLVRVTRKSASYEPYHGDFSFRGIGASSGSVENKLANTWRRMMERCYRPDAHNYRYYGAKGVSVCRRWHDPAAFIEDVRQLPHWWYKEHFWGEFELDKDYYGANQYGPDTCLWLHRNENVPVQWIYVKDPEGNEHIFQGYSEAAEVTGFTRSSLHRFVTQGLPAILKGRNKAAAGWEFRYCDEDELLIRREIIPDGDLGPVYGAQWRNCEGVDQIDEVIKSLRDNPFSRRHIVSAWNPKQIPHMALAPCHTLFQFYVQEVDGKRHLSCHLYQRSADSFLGVPFNIVGYSLLTHMLAHYLGYEVGEFVWSGGDCHLYLNHLGQVQEMMQRYPLPLPTLKLDYPADTPLWYVDPEKITLEGYEHHPAIKAPVAV